MYSSCLICHDHLGRNDVVRRFPVGRRIAFAPESGRIWVICDRCGEWNLAPIEERWEATAELGELLTTLGERAVGDDVSLAHSDQVALIRVGKADGPGFSSLRYGERLADRSGRRTLARRAVWTLQGVSTLAAGVVGGIVGGFSGAAFALIIGAAVSEVVANRRNPVVARVPIGEGTWEPIKRRDLEDARLVPEEGGGWLLRIRPGLELRGDMAIEAARYLLPRLNWSGQAPDTLRKAWNYLEKKGGTAASVFGAAARRRGKGRTARLSKLDPHIRLALEIVTDGEVESRDVAESLDRLHEAWEAAEELAVIQDELVYNPKLLRRFRELKG